MMVGQCLFYLLLDDHDGYSIFAPGSGLSCIDNLPAGRQAGELLMKVLKPGLRLCLLTLTLGSLMISPLMADEPGSLSQPLLLLENQMPIEGKMTAVFTGDKVRLSIQGGPLEIPLAEQASREPEGADRAARTPAKPMPRALGAAALDDRQYDRFGRDAQDLSTGGRLELGGATPELAPIWPWAQPVASYVHGGWFGLDPALGASRSAVSRTQLRQMKVSPGGRLTRSQKLRMQARMDR